jgi:hypothetical protein
LLIAIGLLVFLMYGWRWTFGASLTTRRAMELLEPVREMAGADSALLLQLDRAAQLLGYAFLWFPVALGFLFILFGLVVHRLPLPITIAGLVIFLVFIVLQAVIEPAMVAMMIYLKLVGIAALAQAIRVAYVYEKEARGHAAPPVVSRVLPFGTGPWEPAPPDPSHSHLIGQTICSQQTFPWFAATCLTTSAALVVTGIVAGDSNFALGALSLVAAAVALLYSRPQPFSFTLTDTELRVSEPPQAVPYAGIEGILAGGRFALARGELFRHFVIQVVHVKGVIVIPSRLSVPSREVCEFLFDRIAVRSTRPVHAELADRLRQKQDRFGAEAVCSFAARLHQGRPVTGVRARAFFLALFLSGWLVVAWGSTEFWRVTGGVLCGGSAFLWFVCWFAGYSEVARVKGGRASLVIAPDGITALQGSLNGEVRWNELLGIEFKLFSGAAGARIILEGEPFVGGIFLKVASGRIHLTDVYDRPLALVYREVCRIWRGDRPADGVPGNNG